MMTLVKNNSNLYKLEYRIKTKTYSDLFKYILVSLLSKYYQLHCHKFKRKGKIEDRTGREREILKQRNINRAHPT